MTDLQIMPYVFGSNCAFYLIAKYVMMFPFPGSFLYALPFWHYKARLDLLGQHIGQVIAQLQLEKISIRT